MFMKRAYVSATAEEFFQAGNERVRVKLWVPSQLDSGNASTHVWVHTDLSQCTRYKGVPLLTEAKHSFVLEPHERFYAITEDMAIMGVSTEPV